MITLEEALGHSSEIDELKTMILNAGGSLGNCRAATAPQPQALRSRPWPSSNGKARRARARSAAASMEAETRRRRRGAPARRRPRPSGRVKKEGGLGDINIQIGTRRHAEGSADLHAPARDDDRRRSAARAVPRHPREPDARTSRSRRSCSSVKNSVEQGATFSDALSKHPKVFDELYVNLVAAGEIGGILDTILNRLAVYIEKAVKLKRPAQERDVLPDRHPRRRDRRHRGDADQGHPDVREACTSDMGNAAAARRRRRSSSTSRTRSSTTGTCSSARSSALVVGIVGDAAHRWRPRDHRPHAAADAGDRAACCARSSSRASRARSARCCRRACRSSTRSTSARAPPVTASSRPASCARKDKISEGHDMAGPLAESQACSRRWSSR